MKKQHIHKCKCMNVYNWYVYIYKYINVHIHTIDAYMRGMHASIILSFPTPFSVNQLHCMFLASSLLLFFLHSFIPEFLPSFHFLIPLLPPFFLPWLLSSLLSSFPSLFCLPSFNFLSGRCFPDIYYGFVQIVLMMMMMMMMVVGGGAGGGAGGGTGGGAALRDSNLAACMVFTTFWSCNFSFYIVFAAI